MIKYGSEETMTMTDDQGSTNSVYSQVRNGLKGLAAKRYIHNKIVNGSKEETQEYLEWSKRIESLRTEGKLWYDKDDPGTRPSFTIKYPHRNVDGSYMVIKQWMEKHDLFS